MIDFAQLVSNGMTVSLLILGFMVLYYWHGAFKDAVLAFIKDRSITGRQALISGVYVSFLALMLDNAYWGFTWTLVYLDEPFGYVLRDNGIFPNIPFRQMLGIFATFLHIYAHKRDDDVKVAGYKMNLAGMQLIIAIAAGFIFSVVIYIIK